MHIEYANGRQIEVDNEDEAREILEKEYPDAVFCDQWELHHHAPDDGHEVMRLLVWENEEIAGEPGTGDDGSHAIAEIIGD